MRRPNQAQHDAGRARRQGTATAEMAVALSVIFLIMFGTLEACNVTFLKQALTEAAYEGVLEGMKPNATQADVMARVQAVLDARNIQGTSITAEDAASNPIEQVPAGTIFSVAVTAQTSQNLLVPQMFVDFSHVGADVKARKQ